MIADTWCWAHRVPSTPQRRRRQYTLAERRGASSERTAPNGASLASQALRTLACRFHPSRSSLVTSSSAPRRIDRLDGKSEAEATHHSGRCLISRLTDADDVIEAPLLEPVVHPRLPGLGGVPATSERLPEAPANLDGRQDLEKEPRHRQPCPPGEPARVTNNHRGHGEPILGIPADRPARKSSVSSIVHARRNGYHQNDSSACSRASAAKSSSRNGRNTSRSVSSVG